MGKCSSFNLEFSELSFTVTIFTELCFFIEKLVENKTDPNKTDTDVIAVDSGKMSV
tara:strand:+ start:93 stop:260 length:168 start_codon:yes stop_codon:yes gene_type:complete